MLADGFYKVTRLGKRYIICVKGGTIVTPYPSSIKELRRGLTYIDRIEDW